MKFDLTQDINNDLIPLVGTEVSVTWSSVKWQSAGYHTALSVHGALERKGTSEYRVLVTNETYAYFTAKDVTAIVPFSKGTRVFIEKAVAP